MALELPECIAIAFSRSLVRACPLSFTIRLLGVDILSSWRLERDSLEEPLGRWMLL